MNPNLPGDKRGLPEKSRKSRKLSQCFLTSNDFSHTIFDTQNIKDEKNESFVTPKRVETLLRKKNLIRRLRVGPVVLGEAHDL